MSTPAPEHLRIGEFARRAGTNERTVRYYEELGILEPVRRSSGGFRYYRPSDLDRVKLIGQLKGLGLQLEEIRDLLACPPGTECGDTSEGRSAWLERLGGVLGRQEALIEEKIATLEQQRAEIAEARSQLGLCGPCDRRPEAQNNFCSPCQHTGDPLPALLNALFR